MPRRRADKIDANQPEIVEHLEKLGFSVEVGHDDILVGKDGKTWWFEIKHPDCANNRGQVFRSSKKPSQILLEENWQGHYKIVTCVEDILEDIRNG